MGKGDSYRPVNRDRFNDNYDRIFGEQQAPASEAPEGDPFGAAWDDEACDRELLEHDDNFCLDCMGHQCVCEEDDGDC